MIYFATTLLVALTAAHGGISFHPDTHPKDGSILPAHKRVDFDTIFDHSVGFGDVTQSISINHGNEANTATEVNSSEQNESILTDNSRDVGSTASLMSAGSVEMPPTESGINKNNVKDDRKENIIKDSGEENSVKDDKEQNNVEDSREQITKIPSEDNGDSSNPDKQVGAEYNSTVMDLNNSNETHPITDKYKTTKQQEDGQNDNSIEVVKKPPHSSVLCDSEKHLYKTFHIEDSEGVACDCHTELPKARPTTTLREVYRPTSVEAPEPQITPLREHIVEEPTSEPEPAPEPTEPEVSRTTDETASPSKVSTLLPSSGRMLRAGPPRLGSIIALGGLVLVILEFS